MLLCLEIRLLGGFTLRYQGEPVVAVNTPRLQSLFAYLLLHSNVPQSRHQLAFLLWPDSTEAQALTNLRKHLLHLKQALPAAEEWLLADRHTIQWSPQVEVALDVAGFQRACAQAEGVDNHAAQDALQQALKLYQGELLPGCYDEWILPVREALHRQYFTALERLSTVLEAQRRYDDAIQSSQQLLHDDPLHEATYRRLIRLYALKGDRAAALRIYHNCVTQLRAELGVDPDAETQAIYERLLHGAPVVATAQPVMAAHAPFIGREAEWHILQQRWRLALGGQPQLVLLAGEAGIGKTRLAEELLYWASHQGFCTVRSRCYAAEGRLTYAPIIEWLRSEKLRSQRAKLANSWLSEMSRLLPEILSDNPKLPAPEPITQGMQRHQLFEAVVRALLAGNQPLLLVVDDLQWCDRETLELLHFLLRNAPTLGQAQLLVVGTVRLPDEVDATHPLHDLLNPLRGGDTLTQLDLVRLSEAETSALARQMAEQELDPQTLNQLFIDTAGNPLFLVETMRAGAGQSRRNGLAAQAGTAALAPIATDDAMIEHLPPKVLAVIQARLAHLSPMARELCEWAAIIGRAFTLDLLANASKISLDKVVNALDELWQRRIIHEQGSDAYDFSHDRIRDVAAAEVSRVRRKYLHRCVAEALEDERISQLDNIAAQIAAHYDAAGSITKAINYYEQAAHHARQISANHETVAHLQRSLRLLMNLPASKKRDQRELTFLNAIGPALAALTGYTSQQLGEIYERAYTLSQHLGETPNPALLRILAIHKIGIGTFEQVDGIGQHLLELADQPSERDPVLYVEGCYVLGVNAFWQGRFSRAKTYLQQALDGYSTARHERHIADYGLDPGVYCRARLGWTLWYLGYPDQARQQCIAAVALAQELQHPFTLYLALAFVVWLQLDCRDDGAVEMYIRLFSCAMDPVSSQISNVYQFLQSWSLVRYGQGQTAISQIRDYIAWRQLSKTDTLYGAHAFAILAEAYTAAGDVGQAFAALGEGFALFGDGQEYWYIAELYRVKGELLIEQGRQLADAEACFQQALDIARRQEAKSLELRAAMSLARLWHHQGKHSTAKTLLIEVYNWFTEGFDTPDLQEAQNLLVALGWTP